ncbi:MAG: 3-hydroxyacyl-CoA dehydrogenase NAD-binding domain-containing protein [Pseudolabrys sp.]
MTEAERDAVVGRLSRTTDIGKLGGCELVIEAVFEDLAVKRKLMGELEAVCFETAIFGSNTSTLSITEIASGCKRPERVVGMHFCLPAQLMKLVEMSPGILTSDAVFQAAWDWTLASGQMPVKNAGQAGLHPQCAARALQQ